MQAERIDTLVVGGGQAGLVMSHMLRNRGREHLVLERRRIAERWRSERWEGLRFQFPNWSVRLPDFPFPHADPDGFATPQEIVDYLVGYASFVGAPVRSGVNVTRLARHEATGFRVETSHGPIIAANVVIATGPYQTPVTPKLLADGADIFQVHASLYRAPDQLPAGSVLVVGSGASGTQIAEELLRAGRRVYLSLGRHRRMPRRYRGRDLTWWLSAMGLDQRRTEERGPDKSLPLITGAYGGHTIDFRRLAEQGIVLLGRIKGWRDAVFEIAPDAHASIAFGDAAYVGFLDLADAHVQRLGIDMPPDPAARAVLPNPPCLLQPVTQLDRRAADINAIIWSTGYACDFTWVDLPVLDANGEPMHRRGVTDVPGCYFLGLQWLSKMNSSFLVGVADDAERLAEQIAASS